MVLRLQRPDKTSRTFSKPPSTDRKEPRERAMPGGAKPGHEGHSRVVSEDASAVVEHRPDRCACCNGALHDDISAEVVSVSERIELPAVMPVVTQHRRLAEQCPTCGARVVEPVPDEARGTPVRPAAACGGDLSQDVSGAVLRTAPGGWKERLIMIAVGRLRNAASYLRLKVMLANEAADLLVIDLQAILTDWRLDATPAIMLERADRCHRLDDGVRCAHRHVIDCGPGQSHQPAFRSEAETAGPMIAEIGPLLGRGPDRRAPFRSSRSSACRSTSRSSAAIRAS